MQKGSTLVETIIVIAVIGILVSTAIPRLANALANQELDTFAVNLAADIRSIQQTSMNLAGEDAPLYRIYFNNASGDPYYFIHNGYKAIKVVYLPKHIEMTGDPGYIMFSHKGAPLRGQTIELKCKGTRKYLHVYIAGATGRVRISPSGNLAD